MPPFQELSLSGGSTLANTDKHACVESDTGASEHSDNVEDLVAVMVSQDPTLVIDGASDGHTVHMESTDVRVDHVATASPANGPDLQMVAGRYDTEDVTNRAASDVASGGQGIQDIQGLADRLCQGYVEDASQLTEDEVRGCVLELHNMLSRYFGTVTASQEPHEPSDDYRYNNAALDAVISPVVHSCDMAVPEAAMDIVNDDLFEFYDQIFEFDDLYKIYVYINTGYNAIPYLILIKDKSRQKAWLEQVVLGRRE